MEKISTEEILLLQEKADKERTIHREILQHIENTENSWKSGNNGDLQDEDVREEIQLLILKRERKDELMPLLKSYAQTRQESNSGYTKRVLSSEFQQKLYEKRLFLVQAYCYMIENCVLSFEMEKNLIDSESNQATAKKSKQGEVYLINKTFELASKGNPLVAFDRIRAYFKVTHFSEVGELTLVKNVASIKTGRDSYIDGSINLLKDYVSIYGFLTEEAEQALVESNSHELIMLYLENSKEGLKSPQAVEKLLSRANRQEVELYFLRYSKL